MQKKSSKTLRKNTVINKYNIIITKEAERDLQKIYDYIEYVLYADTTAKNIIKEIKDRIIKLKDYLFYN